MFIEGGLGSISASWVVCNTDDLHCLLWTRFQHSPPAYLIPCQFIVGSLRVWFPSYPHWPLSIIGMSMNSLTRSLSTVTNIVSHESGRDIHMQIIMLCRVSGGCCFFRSSISSPAGEISLSSSRRLLICRPTIMLQG